MTRFLVRRIISMLIVLFIITTVTFFLMHAIPGGPFSRDKELPPAVLAAIEARYKLDQPIWRQYLDYMGNLLRGDLGPSFKYVGRQVTDMIKQSFPISATLGLLAVSTALALGIPAGITSALKQNKWQDNAVMFFAIIGVSVPSFVIAAVLMYVFALKLRWLPPAMWGKPSQAIMPVVALAAMSMAIFARLMRSSMLEVVNQDYIKVARAKGLPERTVIWRHAVRNALIPVVTVAGPLVADVLTGSFVIERIFAIPGLGRHFVTSINNRDYTVTLGVTVFYSAFLVLMMLLVDLAYAWLDPRIKITGEKE
ncbi:MAG: ABC transporter permease [Chloroflexota bacterium]